MILRGLSASPGIAIGRALIINHPGTEIAHKVLDPALLPGEMERFQEALNKAKKNINRMQKHTRKIFGEELASVFTAHRMFLEDEAFTGRITDTINNKNANAEWAVFKVIEDIKKKLEKSGDIYLSERVVDLDDVARQLLTALEGERFMDIDQIDEKVIVVGHDLAPSELVRYTHKNIVGYITEKGGPTSHTAIIAKALGLPTVIGVVDITKEVGDHDLVIVDGAEGKIVINPDESMLNEYENKQQRYNSFFSQLENESNVEAVTKDHVHIDLMANIELSGEIPLISKYRADGIGLYRSEFLYLTMAPGIPTEEDHYNSYVSLLKPMGDLPVVIRTFDLGGRKLAREMLHLPEDNPVLGMRGIRLCLNTMEIFKPQLRALLRASVHGNLHIMIPMVSGIHEIRQTKSLIAQIMNELDAEGIPHKKNVPLGIMIEVPSMAILADRAVDEVDFVSLGTNDLIQYTLAVDRNNEQVSYLYEPFHPAILTLIKNVVDQAIRTGCGVSVCGEMAGDPMGALILIGLGIRRLSMEPASLPIIKDTIRKISVRKTKSIVRNALQLHTAKEVSEYIMESLITRVPGGTRVF